MTESEFRAVLQSEIEASLGYLGDELSEARANALARYFGRPYGDEAEGRSAVVMSEVRDTVESIMPSLVKVFLSGERVVSFAPVGPEDVGAAEQETDVVNHALLKDNDAFAAFYAWMKDGLLGRCGVLKYWWDDAPRTEAERYEGLSDDELALLAADPEAELAAHRSYRDAAGAALHDATAVRTLERGRLRIEPVPPEEFLISRRAKGIADAPFVGHRVRRTVSDLVAAGFDRETVEGLAGAGGAEADAAPERLERFGAEEARSDADNPALRELWVTECYLRVDHDGDGVAELRRALAAGEGGAFEVLENAPWEGAAAPFCALCPVPVPHKFFGLSVADLVDDIQRIKTVLMRQMLDNLYLANNPRKRVVEDQVNLDDLLTSRPGGLVRVKDIAAIAEERVEFTAAQSFPMLEYLDTLKENRTGVTKYNQGLDADSLNKTATGIARIMNASAERLELIARIYAETGFRALFLGVHELLRKHGGRELAVRIRNRWVAVDPGDWRRRFDLTVHVGSGAGNADQRKADALMVLQLQKELAAFGLVGPAHAYAAFEKLIEATGWKTPERYMAHPGADDAAPPETEALERALAEAQAALAELRADRALAEAELELKGRDSERDHDIARRKIELGYAELAAKREAEAAGTAGPAGPEAAS
ncbi:MAG: hypothetical protein J4F33_08920 [Alphaproteobacteria bacterium]|nr:hypothetical protein [Alphaproteobacteria bacterium]